VETNVLYHRISAAKSNAGQYHRRQKHFGFHLIPKYPQYIPDSGNDLVQQCDFRIVVNDNPDLSMEVQADSWSRETEKLDQEKFFRPEHFYIASRVEEAIALTTLTIAAMEKDEGEI
jgi:hypothetical protein